MEKHSGTTKAKVSYIILGCDILQGGKRYLKLVTFELFPKSPERVLRADKCRKYQPPHFHTILLSKHEHTNYCSTHALLFQSFPSLPLSGEGDVQMLPTSIT